MTESLRMKRLTLPAPNLMLDPTGRAVCELEGDPGTSITLFMPYPDIDVPSSEDICVFIKNNIDPGLYTYDDDTCSGP